MEYSGKRRKLILDKIKAQLREERETEFLSDMDFRNWDEAFDKLNLEFWHGTLSKIPVSIEATKKKRLGWFGHSGYIKLSSNKGMTPIEMLGVLLHEMCHHHVNEKHGHGKSNGRGGRVIGHGKEWKAEMRRVGYIGKITMYSGKERFVKNL
jgi:hypothetical protein